MRKLIEISMMTAMVLLLSCCKNKGSQAGQETSPTQEQTENAAASASTKAPDFLLFDLQGKPLSLSSLRGKVVVLDFWGSWCVWCIRGVPKMKEYYSKYKDKMEILGIDCNDDIDTWKKAVAELELPWLHVYNPDNTLLKTYGIEGFPTKIVIDAEGNVLRTIVGEDPAFYQYLDQLFS